mmetsp:Transcript_109860/g.251986  ORF Transcript_109860/g.251986 Transcript_109860/m.251986 type:complete len:260 (-) Transcript_109860:136-915(-)
MVSFLMFWSCFDKAVRFRPPTMFLWGILWIEGIILWRRFSCCFFSSCDIQIASPCCAATTSRGRSLGSTVSTMSVCENMATQMLGDIVWRSLIFLTISAVVDGKIFCVHGGLSPEVRHVDEIRMIQRAQEVPHEGAVGDLMWSDPEEIPGWATNPRGAGWLFGVQPTEQFCHINDFELIARAHQMAQEGYKFAFSKPGQAAEEGLLVTVWSAPNYCYRCGNLASVLLVDENCGRSFKTFKEVPESAESVPPRQLVPYFL